MRLFVNPNRFQKALAYASEHFFSKPYSISPSCDRWFNQLAIVELENGNMIYLNREMARKYVDILVDGEKVKNEDIDLVIQYFSLKASDETKSFLNQLEELDISHLENELKKFGIPDSDFPFVEKLRRYRIPHDDPSFVKKLKEYFKAKKVYEDIVDRGESHINEERIAEQEGAKVRNIIHRPNHGLVHSVRAAAYIALPEIHHRPMQLRNRNYHFVDEVSYDQDEIERLQLMMLFSVVGRKDETGFKDTSSKEGSQVYKSFRATSGREYLKYCKAHAQELYNGDEKAMLRDAIVVELMGNQQVSRFSLHRSKIAVLTDYVAEEKQCSTEKALEAIRRGEYDDLFSEEEYEQATNFLKSMNASHGLDLARCYPFETTKESGPQFIGSFNSYILKCNLIEEQSLENLKAFYRILRTSMDMMKLTGQKTTFGLISQEEFDEKKDEILTQIRVHDDIFDVLKSYFIRPKEKLGYNKRMFDFKALDSDGRVDDKKTAQETVAGFLALDPPTITNVTREENNVRLSFDSEEEAQKYIDLHHVFFDGELAHRTDESKGSVVIQVEADKYKKLRNTHRLRFKEVTIPREFSRETELVDTQTGRMEAENLIHFSRGLTRIFSTSVLEEQDIPDYDFFFRSLNDPVHERFVSQSQREKEQTVYYDPRTGERYQRKLQEKAVPLHLQEPVTEPIPFAERVSDGLHVVSKANRGRTKNTVFTKKMAHSLLPPHGKMVPFLGYGRHQYNYFPIGILSDVSKVNLKDERYIWAQNMVTHSKFWLKEKAALNEQLLKFLDAKKVGKLVDKPIDDVVQEIEKNIDGIGQLLDKKFYQSPEFLEELINRSKAQKRILLRQFSSEADKERIKHSFEKLESRLYRELNRESPKYAIKLRELIQRQKSSSDAMAHNEILAGNTKTATRALFANKDTLFYRLNLAFHAMRIKKEFGIDVPLLIISENNPPYTYTEQQIRSDIMEAYHKLQNGTFPYVQERVGVHGEDGKPVLDEQGIQKTRPKSQKYQRNFLLDFFKEALPEHVFPTKEKHINFKQIKKGKIRDYKIDIDEVASNFIKKLDLVGSIPRERKLMRQGFTNGTKEEKKSFFLRQVILGNKELVDEILSKDGLLISLDAIEKGLRFAEKNHHPSIQERLQNEKEKIIQAKRKTHYHLSRAVQLKNAGSPEWRMTFLIGLQLYTQHQYQFNDKKLDKKLEKILNEKGNFLVVCSHFASNEEEQIRMKDLLSGPLGAEIIKIIDHLPGNKDELIESFNVLYTHLLRDGTHRPLYVAAANLPLSIVKSLIPSVGDLSDSEWKELFESAIEHDQSDFIALLIEKKPKIMKHLDGRGRTPLHLAIESNKKNAVEQMILAGVDLSVKYRDRTPLEAAKKTGNTDIRHLLERAQALQKKKEKYRKPSSKTDTFIAEAKGIIQRYLAPTGCTFFASREKNYRNRRLAMQMIDEIQDIQEPQPLIDLINEQIQIVKDSMPDGHSQAYLTERYCRHLLAAKEVLLENIESVDTMDIESGMIIGPRQTS